MYIHRFIHFQAFLLTLLIVLLSSCSDAINQSQPKSPPPPPVSLKSLEISPNNANLAINTQIKLYAIGIYSDNTKRDLSDKVVWESSEPSKAELLTIGVSAKSAGTVAAKETGIYRISASLDSIDSQPVNVNISNAALNSIVIESTQSATISGTTSNLAAIGLFSDGSKQILTDFVAWASSDSAIAKFSENIPGAVLALQAGSADATASFGGKQSAPLNLTVSSSTLVSLEVRTNNSTIGLGTHTQFSAFGIYADSSTQTITEDVVWTSSNEKVARLSNSQGSKGIATAFGDGVSTITAEFDGLSSTNSVKLVVTESNLEEILIEMPPNSSNLTLGSSVHLKATGIYRDLTRQDLTNEVIWMSSDRSVAAIDNAHGNSGLVKPVGTGTTEVTALYQGVLSESVKINITTAKLSSISVTPTATQLAIGVAQQYKAKGTYTDETERDISKSVHWESTNANFATISNTFETAGLANATNIGTTLIKAHLSNLTSNSVTLITTDAILEKLTISPRNSTTILGEAQQFSATGFYNDQTITDLTDQVTWESRAPLIVSMSNAAGSVGLALSLNEGSATISASFQGLTVNTILSVGAASLVSIKLSPLSAALQAGRTQQFTATGIYTDKTANITDLATWVSDAPGVATVNNKGMVTAIGVGNASITASFNGMSSTTKLSVTLLAPTIALKSVTGSPSVVTGKILHITASGGTTPYTWSVDNLNNATITAKGKFTGIIVGPVIVTATDNKGYSGSLLITVTTPPVTLVSIDITPVNAQITSGDTRQFSAIGIYSDTSEIVITDNVDWTSNSSTITFSTTTIGLALSSLGSTGAVIITGKLNSVSNQTQLTVTGSTISISPATSLIQVQEPSVKMTATGGTPTYSWSVNDNTIATIDSNGLLTPLKSGDIIVTATDSRNFSGSRIFGITGPPIAKLFLDQALQACVDNYAMSDPQNILTTADQITTLGTYCDGVKIFINNESTQITSLSGIENLTNLISLDLENNLISDLTPLKKLTKLTTLRLQSNKISIYAPLSALINLKHLDLSNNIFSATTDLSAINTLSNLEILYFANDKIKANPIGLTSAHMLQINRLSNLTVLDLTDNNIIDVSFLRSLTNLNTLSLGSNPEFSGFGTLDLQSFNKLTYLNLNSTSISDITPLGSLPSLKYLHMSNTSATFKQALFDSAISNPNLFFQLTLLHLGGTSITDFSVLSNLLNFDDLNVENSQISDFALTTIGSLTNLTSLNISGNPITDFSALANLTGLTSLNLRKTGLTGTPAGVLGIAGLDIVGGLINLTSLTISENPITDFSALANLTGLTLLGLANTGLTRLVDLNVIGGLTNLQTLYVYSNEIVDVAPLQSLTSIRKLYLGNNSIGIDAAGNPVKGNVDSLVTLINVVRLILDNDDGIYNNLGMSCAELRILIGALNVGTTPVVWPAVATPIVAGTPGGNCVGP